MFGEIIKWVSVLIVFLTIIFFFSKKYPFIGTIFIFVFISFIGIFIGILCLLFYLFYNADDEFINKNYKYIRDPKTLYQRVLDNGDKMPEIYCVHNISEIETVIKDRELIYDMMSSLEASTLPCVSSYHFKRKNDTAMPNFILLNKRFNTLNSVGEFLKYATKLFGLSNNPLLKIAINTVGTVFYQGEHYYIFNVKKIGGSKNKNVKVRRSTTLCEWSGKSKEEFLRYFSIQIEAIEVIFHKGKMYAEESILRFYGELAYCIQDFLDDIKGKYICND